MKTLTLMLPVLWLSFSQPSHAAPLSTGEVTVVNANATCPPMSPKVAYALPGTITCQELSVSRCSDGAGGFLNPISVFVQIAERTSPGPDLGTLIVHAGGGGNKYMGNGFNHLDSYRSEGFRVIRPVWDPAGMVNWEDGQTPNRGSKYAACRVASLVKWVKTKFSRGATKPICYEGSSGGSAAGSFVMSWYGGENLLDFVVLDTGPPMAAVDIACNTFDPLRNQTPNICPAPHSGMNKGPGYFKCIQPYDPVPEYYHSDDCSTPEPKVKGRTAADSFDQWAGTGTCSQNLPIPPADIVTWRDRNSVVASGMDTVFQNTTTLEMIPVDMYMCSNTLLNAAHTGGMHFAQAQATNPAFSVYCYGENIYPQPADPKSCIGEGLGLDARQKIIADLRTKCVKAH